MHSPDRLESRDLPGLVHRPDEVDDLPSYRRIRLSRQPDVGRRTDNRRLPGRRDNSGFDTQTTEAKAAVAAILEPGESLADTSLWADEVRNRMRYTAPWYYVDVPTGDEGFADLWSPCRKGKRRKRFTMHKRSLFPTLDLPRDTSARLGRRNGCMVDAARRPEGRRHGDRPVRLRGRWAMTEIRRYCDRLREAMEAGRINLASRAEPPRKTIAG
jgi:hypothetical protein